MGKKPNLDVTDASLWECVDVWDDLTGADGHIVYLFTHNTTPRPVVRIAKDRSSLSVKNNRTLTLSVSDNPEVLRVDKSDIPQDIIDKVSKWVKENREEILKFWSEKIDFGDFFEIMRNKERENEIES